MKRLMIIAGTGMLSACSPTVENAAGPVPAAEIASSPCTRGAIDSYRSFVICPSGTETSGAIAAALNSPADLSLDLASVADSLGVPRQAISGIEPATYARIVPNEENGSGGGATPPKAKRDPNEIEVGDRVFLRREIEMDDGKAVILIER